MARPFVFGYLVERLGGPPLPMPAVPTTARAASLGLFFEESAIARFACRHGLELAHIYRDHAPDAITEPGRTGIAALIRALVRRDDIVAVIIAAESHLGQDPAAIRRLIEQHVRVLSVRLPDVSLQGAVAVSVTSAPRP